MEFFKGRTAEIINYLFQTLLVTYLGLLLIEQLWKGFVSHYLNTNYLLAIVIFIGIISVFSHHPNHKEHVSLKDYLLIALLTLAGFIILKIKTADLGWLSWIIAVIAALIICLLSLLILEDEDVKKD